MDAVRNLLPRTRMHPFLEKMKDARVGFDTKVIVRPRYVTPRLPFWSSATSPASETPPCGRGRIVLIGNATHIIEGHLVH